MFRAGSGSPGGRVWRCGARRLRSASRSSGRARGLALPVALIVAQTANVALTTPAQEFRFAFPTYVMSLVLIGVTIVRVGPTDVVRE